MSKKKQYDDTFSEIVGSIGFFREVENDKGMAYIDEYTTNQQRVRDKKITDLLSKYVDTYSYKSESNKWYKGILFGICVLILMLFSVVFVVLIFKIDITKAQVSTEGVIQFISVCVTFLTLIVSILKIITKYVFPEKEEEYITRIVEIIQNNDLENKKENIKVKANNLSKSTEE